MALIRGAQISGSVASASYVDPLFISASMVDYGFGAGGSGTGFSIVSGSVTASVNTEGNIFFIQSGSNDLVTVLGSGQTTISGSANDLFIVKGAYDNPILTVSQSGVVVFATQASDPSGLSAPNGGVTFTSTNFFVGLD